MTQPRAAILSRTAAALIAAVAWYALALQLQILLAGTPANGLTPAMATLNFFSFFTILTNTLLTLALTLTAAGSRSLLTRASAQAAIALYIAFVGITYSLLLRALWNPQGSQKIADTLLHDVVPVAYWLYWLTLAPKRGLQYRDLRAWLLYPVAYLVYALTRGAIDGWYPYPFVNVTSLGYPHVLRNAVLLTAAFLVFSILLIAILRALYKEKPPGP